MHHAHCILLSMQQWRELSRSSNGQTLMGIPNGPLDIYVQISWGLLLFLPGYAMLGMIFTNSRFQTYQFVLLVGGNTITILQLMGCITDFQWAFDPTKYNAFGSIYKPSTNRFVCTNCRMTVNYSIRQKDEDFSFWNEPFLCVLMIEF